MSLSSGRTALRLLGPLWWCLAATFAFRAFVATVRWIHAIHPGFQVVVGLMSDVALAMLLAVLLVAGAVFQPVGSSARSRLVRLAIAMIETAMVSIYLVILVANIGSVVYWDAYLGPEDLTYLLDLPFLWGAVSMRARELPWHAVGLAASGIAGAVAFQQAWKRAKVVASALKGPLLGMVGGAFVVVACLLLMTAAAVRFVRGEPLENHPVGWLIERSFTKGIHGVSERGIAFLHRHLHRLGATWVPGSPSLSRNVRTFGLPNEPSPPLSIGTKLPHDTNIVMILLESFSASAAARRPEAIRNLRAFFAAGVELRRHFTTMYRTSGAELAALCSIYNPSEFLATRTFPHTRLDCLPSLLKRLGYRTIAVSGDPDPRDREADWLRANDFDVVLTVDDFPDARASWPAKVVDDDRLYRRVLSEMERAPKPVFVLVVAESNHYPYSLPPEYDAAHPETRQWEPLHRTMQFADDAFGRFWTEVWKRFPNTLVVVFGDHGPWMTKEGGPGELPDFQGTRERYHVLAGIAHPLLRPRRIERTTTHLDLAPTILALLGGTFETDFIGRSVFEEPVLNPVLSVEAQSSSAIVLHDDLAALFLDLRAETCRAVTAQRPHEYRDCLPEEAEMMNVFREAFLDSAAVTIRASRLR